MTRTFGRVAAVALAAAGVAAAGCASSGGPGGRLADTAPDGESALCKKYTNCVDPCWPERYNATARGEVLAPFAAQVNNGTVMEYTVWNWHWENEPGKEPGRNTPTDRLTNGGKAKLDEIARARPFPAGKVYLQAARDPDTGGNLGDADKQRDLDSRRAAAIMKYLETQPTAHPVQYQVFVHDPAPIGMPAEFAAGAFRAQFFGYRGGLLTTGPLTSQGTGSNQPTPTTTINNVQPAPATSGGVQTGPAYGPGGTSTPSGGGPGGGGPGGGAPGGPGGN